MPSSCSITFLNCFRIVEAEKGIGTTAMIGNGVFFYSYDVPRIIKGEVSNSVCGELLGIGEIFYELNVEFVCSV